MATVKAIQKMAGVTQAQLDAAGGNELVPVMQVSASGVSYDSTGIPSLGSAVPRTRARMLVFGNSIAAQSCPQFVGMQNISDPNRRAGTTSVTATTPQTASAGAKMAFFSYDSSYVTTTLQTSVTSSTALTLAKPLAKMVRYQGSWSFYTTPTVGTVRQFYGLVSAAIAQMGMPVEIVCPSYGYGGAKIQEIVADLPRMLAASRPHYVALHLLENNISTGEVFSTDLLPWLKSAVETCLRFGAIPFVISSVPSIYYNSAPAMAAFDAQHNYINGGGLKADYPAAIPVDASSPWLDTSVTANRKPLPGNASDGIHPDYTARHKLASLIKQPFVDNIPSTLQNSYSIMKNVTLSGTTGTLSGSATGVVPTSFTGSYTGAGSCVFSKNIDGSLKCTLTITGASNVTTDQVVISQYLDIPESYNNTVWLRAFAKFRINSQSNFSIIYPQIAFNSGEIFSAGQTEINWPTDTTVLGKVLRYETPPAQCPELTTGFTFSFLLRPQTLSSPSGVSIDIDILELGVEPALAYYA